MKCDHCGTDAGVVVEVPIGEDIPPRCWCLDCAKADGWPWLVPEQPKARRKAVPA